MAKDYRSISVFVILAVGLFHVAYTLENVLISPFLLAEGLSQLYLGAQGNTAKELASVITHFSLNKSMDIDAYLADSREDIKSTDDIILKYGNWMYVADDVEILPNYEELLGRTFKTKIQHVNFNDPNTVSMINNFVEQQTDNKITNLLDNVSGDDAFILVSAIYFKGLWKHPFEKRYTAKRDFYLLNEGELSKIQVDTMTRLDFYRKSYIEELQAHAIELPYSNSNISMIIILPKEIDGVVELIQQLPNFGINNIMQNSTTELISVFIPKLKFEYSIVLNDLLQSIAVQEIFNTANFKSMTNFNRRLHISKIIQKSFIEINEEGTSAQAIQRKTATSYRVINNFEANRPFVFFIKDDKRIYLSGYVLNPLLK